MRQVVRLMQIWSDSLPQPGPAGGLARHQRLQDLAGYIREQPSPPPLPGMVRAWGCLVVLAGSFGEPEVSLAAPGPPQPNGVSRNIVQLRPVGRLAPVDAWPNGGPARSGPAGAAPPAASPALLRPVRSGRSYRLTSPPVRGWVRPALAGALETVFERFAREAGFTPGKPLGIRLSRGFKAGSHGHGEGRAADIAAVGGKSLLAWKQEWDRAMAAVEKLSEPQQRAGAVVAERRRNLGYGLYQALQAYGGWRVNQGGWRVYQGVMQLFGPWTATEGPWKAMQIEEPNPHQQQRLADQQWVFRAHQDHIHVAR